MDENGNSEVEVGQLRVFVDTSNYKEFGNIDEELAIIIVLDVREGRVRRGETVCAYMYLTHYSNLIGYVGTSTLGIIKTCTRLLARRRTSVIQ